jgi:hypothetical protein
MYERMNFFLFSCLLKTPSNEVDQTCPGNRLARRWGSCH